MKEYTPHQQRIIKNYYRNREALALQKLQELVSDLYLADTDSKRARLWKRVEKALVNLKVSPARIEHLLSQRDPKILADNIRDWWEKLPESR